MKFKTIIIAGAVTTIMACSKQVTELPIPASDLLDCAKSYFGRFNEELRQDKVLTSNGYAIHPGDKIGQTLSPTPRQLIALGLCFPNAFAPAGIIKIEFSPIRCMPNACTSMKLTAISKGETLSTTIDIKPVIESKTMSQDEPLSRLHGEVEDVAIVNRRGEVAKH